MDDNTKLDEQFNVLKNIDDFCVFGRTLEDLEMQIKKLIKLCRRINLKLAPSKFSLSTAVKFGGTVISAEKIKDNSVIFLDPPDSRILASRPKDQEGTPEALWDDLVVEGLVPKYHLLYGCSEERLRAPHKIHLVA